jgi:hypothetical protein
MDLSKDRQRDDNDDDDDDNSTPNMIQQRNGFSVIYVVHSAKIGNEAKQMNKETF